MTGSAPGAPEQIREELQRTNDLLVEYGAPLPQYYRPPYGRVSRRWTPSPRRSACVWSCPTGTTRPTTSSTRTTPRGFSPGQIVANVVGPMRDGSIITMHDGLGQATLNSIEALQPIADVMNERRICATTDIRADAGGRVLQFGE